MIFPKKKKTTKKTHNIELGTLYDINKNIVEKSVAVLTTEELNEKRDLIIDFINNTSNAYYMLLCNDRKDYTIFHRNQKCINGEFLDRCEGYTGDYIESVLLDECLPNRGSIKSIELTEDKNAIEIWLSIDGESFVYFFFPYDTAIIEC